MMVVRCVDVYNYSAQPRTPHQKERHDHEMRLSDIQTGCPVSNSKLQWEWHWFLIRQTLSSGRGPAASTKSLTGAPIKASSQLVSEKRPKARNILQAPQGRPTGCRAIRRFKVHAITVACGRRAECQL
ncbi:hypothetical protein J6590_024421 [Homalodisca vitripennis]|nr:hypothetical protein J6590_024421 [Homalodisca vitripennis]